MGQHVHTRQSTRCLEYRNVHWGWSYQRHTSWLDSRVPDSARASSWLKPSLQRGKNECILILTPNLCVLTTKSRPIEQLSSCKHSRLRSSHSCCLNNYVISRRLGLQGTQVAELSTDVVVVYSTQKVVRWSLPGAALRGVRHYRGPRA